MRILYIVLAYLAAPLVLAVMLWRGLRDRSYWQGLPQRFGFGPQIAEASTIWLHAVSVGEVQAAAPLVRRLIADYPRAPVLLTTVTPTGAARARALFGESIELRFVPYDLPGAVRRFFDRARPRAAIILETELWPNLYHECGRRRVPLLLASARISPRSVGRYRMLARLFRETLSHGIVIAAQSEADAERFRQIGANPERTHVVGNIKFDVEVPQAAAAAGRQWRADCAATRPVWIAGSTHDVEEQKVLQAHRAVRAALPGALLLLAPRHPNRFEEVARWLGSEQVRFARRSRQEQPDDHCEVFLLDSLGELAGFYAAADVAFVGGSLIPIGGHNLLEPAALGKPILTGPHNFNSADIAQLMFDAAAAVVVTDETELAQRLGELLGDAAARDARGAAAQAVVNANRGTVDRLMQVIRPVIDSGLVEAPEDARGDR
ncbi:MAG: lipid IV(A) 3-deoxy-D-manno-octulosonic acid transferase [Steroidobacteraceae bacterium]